MKLSDDSILLHFYSCCYFNYNLGDEYFQVLINKYAFYSAQKLSHQLSKWKYDFNLDPDVSLYK